MLFALAINPFLVQMARLDAQGLSATRACADDVGASVASIWKLLDYHSIFRSAKITACLSLKIVKCVIVPTSGKFSLHIKDVIVESDPYAARIAMASLVRRL